MKISFDNIRAEISRKGWTIEQFCKELGISKNTFYSWEEKGDLPLSKCLKMSSMFHKSIDYLIDIDSLSAS